VKKKKKIQAYSFFTRLYCGSFSSYSSFCSRFPRSNHELLLYACLLEPTTIFLNSLADILATDIQYLRGFRRTPLGY